MFKSLFFGLWSALLFYSGTIFSIGFPVSGPVPGISPTNFSLWSLYNNPAGINNLNTIEAGVFYHSLFSIKQVADAGLAVAFPIGKKSVAGIGYRHWGYSLFKQQVLVFAFSKSFGDRLSAGLSFDWNSLFISKGYGKSQTVLAKAGLIIDLSENLQLGFSLFNPVRNKVGKSESIRFPVIVSTGLGINFGSHASMNLGIEKSINQKPVYSAGGEYKISDRFEILAGFSNGANSFYFGYKFSIANYSIGMHSGYHHLLGFSPAINITFKK